MRTDFGPDRLRFAGLIPERVQKSEYNIIGFQPTITKEQLSLRMTRIRFCSAMLCISAAYAVMQCLSVCVSVCLSVTFVNHVKTNKYIFKICSPSGSPIILVFPHQTGWRYSDGNSPYGGVECRWGRQKRNSGRIACFAAYRSTVLSTVRVAKCEKQPRRTAASVEHSPRRPSSVVRTRGR